MMARMILDDVPGLRIRDLRTTVVVWFVVVVAGLADSASAQSKEARATRQHYGSTSAPLVVNDLVIAGVSGGDEGIRGFLVQGNRNGFFYVLDRITGEFHRGAAFGAIRASAASLR
jgi:hypothetical protein